MEVKLAMADFQLDEETGVWVPQVGQGIAYSDGDAVEDEIFNVINRASDLSVSSIELVAAINNWPTEYHFSPRRTNWLKMLKGVGPGTKVLELGCGCGAITKALSETGCSVDAVEGSFRRARTAAKRVHEHADTRVFHSNFQNVAFEQQYDIVTLIGVLEYSPVYLGGKDPFIECLKMAASALKPDGTLVIAIENKLGVKYLAGMGEDHHGVPYYGVEGQYRSGEATTYGKQELIRRLECAGFGVSAFNYAFPDYKLPEVIVSDRGMQQGTLRVDDILFGLENRDHTGQGKERFSINLAYEALFEEGVLGDLANSFLIFATKSGVVKHQKPDVLAQKYTDVRRSDLNCVTEFIAADDNTIAVRKYPLSVSNAAAQSGIILHDFVDEPYVVGRNLGVLLRRAIMSSDVDSFLLHLQRYRIFLENQSQDGLLPSQWMDAIPSNIIVDNIGCLHYIDREWSVNEDAIEMEVVFLRSMLFLVEDAICTSAFPGNGFYERIQYVYAQLALEFDPLILKKVKQLHSHVWADVFANGQCSMGDWYRVAERFKISPKPNLLPFVSPQVPGGQSAAFGRTFSERFADYASWLVQHKPREVDAEVWAERMTQNWQVQPHLTLLMIAPANRKAELQESIEHLQSQLYKNWRLVVIADWPAPSVVFEQTDYLGWLQVDNLDEAATLAEACNGVLSMLPSDWVAILPAGATFPGEYLLSIADYANLWPDAVALYTDHDHYQIDGSRDDPWFKPGFDPDYLFAMDYVGTGVWMRIPQLMMLGGFASWGAWQTYDALLKLYGAYGKGAIGHVEKMLLTLPYAKVSTTEDEMVRQAILQQFFQTQGVAANVLPARLEGTLRVEYLHEEKPLVSIIIPTKDKLEFLDPCVDTLIEKTLWPNWELLIVDNRSEDPDTHEFYQQLQQRLPQGRCRILYYDQSFNFSAQCNMGVAEARGDYILLLNNDTEVVHPEWLDRMMMHAMRPEVGVVGCRLVYPETGKVQHAGIGFHAKGMFDSAAHHPFVGADGLDPGYMNRLWVEQNYAAVTAACLLVSKQTYQAVGGFDEDELAVLFNDVDFCLKVKETGKAVLYTPFATLVHHHGVSISAESNAKIVQQLQGTIRALAERKAFLKRWLPQLSRDPSLSPHLAFDGPSADLERAVPLLWDRNLHHRHRLLGVPIEGGSGIYRLIQPFEALSQAGKLHAEYVLTHDRSVRLPTIVQMSRVGLDTLLLQNPITDTHLECLQTTAELLPGVLRVACLDDLLSAMPKTSDLYYAFRSNFRDAKPRLRKALALCDRLIVSTEPLRAFCESMIADIRVIPNRLSRQTWGEVQSVRGVGRKPRVGWVGAQQHAGDLAMLQTVFETLADEVEWVFMGMWPEGDFAHERHKGVAFEQYPQKMASLNLDLAIAPLEDNPFNEAKSNLRLLEYGVMAWPVVCSDVYPYRNSNAPVTLVSADAQAWIDAIRHHIANPEWSAQQGAALRAWVDADYWLEDHLEDWQAALSR